MMQTNKHALLSASSSHRWLNCPPSAKLSETYGEVVSDFAAEGTEAHSLIEYKLKQALNLPAINPISKLFFYNEEMEDCANGYVAFALELIQKVKEDCNDPLVLIEQKLDYSRFCDGGFGTGDLVIIGNGVIHIMDYKYGRGVEVNAQDNPQMMLYALGALELFANLYDIEKVSMTIYQPRRSNISTFTLTTDELYKWANEVLKPTAELAYKGEGVFKSGDWCLFCKAKTTCRERAKENLKLAQLDFAKPPLLTDEEIEEILLKVDDLVSWANDIQSYALGAALGGKKWNGWKLVEGRSSRKYSDEDLVAQKVNDAGFDPFDKKVKGITEMQKLLGITRFNEILNGLIIKPAGKPTLVLESDKRPEYSTARADFMTNTEE